MLKKWEWEEEKFWNESYPKEMKSSKQKKWNDRIWERECLAKEPVKQIQLKNND